MIESNQSKSEEENEQKKSTSIKIIKKKVVEIVEIIVEIKAYLKSKKVNNSSNKQELINKIKTVSLINKIT